MRYCRLLIPLLLATLPLVAGAEPFAAQDALAGRGLELPGRGPRWQAGVHVHVSAARSILRRVVQQQVDAYVQQHPESAGYQDYAGDARAQQVRQLVAKGDLTAIKQALKDNLGQYKPLQPKDVQAIDAIDQDDVRMLDAWFQVQDSSASAMVVATEPYLAWTGDQVRLSARLPVATQSQGGSSTLRSGNLGLDLQTGAATAGLGANLGLSLWLPTASERTATPLRSDLLSSPGLGGRWLGVQPHVAAGWDLGRLECIARADLTLLAPVASPAPAMRYATVGAAMVLDLRHVALAAEADRLIDLGGGAAVDRVWLLGLAARARLGPVRLGLGARLPVAPGDDAAFGGLAGAWARRFADLQVALDLGVAW